MLFRYFASGYLDKYSTIPRVQGSWLYSQDDLEQARHIHELHQRNLIILNISYNQLGVGGDLPDITSECKEYNLKKNQLYEYSFKIPFVRQGKE